MPHFEVTTSIAASPRRVFDVSLDVGVHTASMADAAEQAVAGVVSGRLRSGDEVTWRARHFGVWWRMGARIVVHEPPEYFVDEQVEGPFRWWRHEHRFAPDGRGGTVMRDVVGYAAPFGPLGRFAEVAVLDRYLRKLIVDRNAHVGAVAEAGG
ncbi:SRPBCC family protein [Umezawaea sp. Da 62-37]|uniref:SRPBCC family protein n=1 Tax=Umezawaea sp. Da 62-37 TaxID=3075927 RepID=UPI0028F73977|nr:SRPBCC family protein [Umezawaea sp. Da 62-37]WNV90554.1 SRPBCC family protein [Umezawaea sp. Da 62-37]